MDWPTPWMAWEVGSTPETSLAIMKDSRVGAFGAVSLVLVLLIKFAFLMVLFDQGRERSLVLFPPHQPLGAGTPGWYGPLRPAQWRLGASLNRGSHQAAPGRGHPMHPLVKLPGWRLFRPRLSLVLAGLVVWGSSRYFRRRLGGVTGDIYGAVNEILETLVLGVAVLSG